MEVIDLINDITDTTGAKLEFTYDYTGDNYTCMIQWYPGHKTIENSVEEEYKILEVKAADLLYVAFLDICYEAKIQDVSVETLLEKTFILLPTLLKLDLENKMINILCMWAGCHAIVNSVCDVMYTHVPDNMDEHYKLLTEKYERYKEMWN